MCVIAAKPRGRVLTDEQIENCGTKNAHGCGYMYPENGVLRIKRFNTWRSFLHSYHKVIRQRLGEEQTPVVAHFRIATRGKVEKENCHPFYINDRMGLAHNGTLTFIWEYSRDNVTDSQIFAREYLGGWITPQLLGTPGVQLTLRKLIGPSNKLAIMDADGTITILNRHFGEEVNGVWFSNKSYETPSPPAPIPTKQYAALDEAFIAHKHIFCEKCNVNIPHEDLDLRAPMLRCPTCSTLLTCPKCWNLLDKYCINFRECLACNLDLEKLL